MVSPSNDAMPPTYEPIEVKPCEIRILVETVAGLEPAYRGLQSLTWPLGHTALKRRLLSTYKSNR